MRIYISGAISGLELKEARRLFQDAEDLIKNWKHTPVNPMKNGLPKNSTWEQHMRRDIQMLMTCECILMLPNWESSRGAKLEHQLAELLGIEIIYLSKL